jgi:hypothetical protein
VFLDGDDGRQLFIHEGETRNGQEGIAGEPGGKLF